VPSLYLSGAEADRKPGAYGAVIETARSRVAEYSKSGMHRRQEIALATRGYTRD
jgi:hypothetical protein